MKNQLDNLLLELEREVKDLKTNKVKSSATITFQQKTFTKNVQLQLSSGLAVATVNVKVIPVVSPSLFTATLDETNDGRTRTLDMFYEDGYDFAYCYIEGTNDDRQTLIQGGTVEVDLSFRVTCLDDFTMEEI